MTVEARFHEEGSPNEVRTEGYPPRFCWRLHFVDGPQWPSGDADGGFGHYFRTKGEAEKDATDHCLLLR